MEEYLKKKIEDLKQQIQELENKKVATSKIGTVIAGSYDSDLGVMVPVKKEGMVPMSKEEIAVLKNDRELQLYTLRSELKQVQDELFVLEWNKPENVEKRKREELVKDEKKLKEELAKERLEHEKEFKELDQLVEFLQMAGMYDLATKLSKMRYSYQKPRSAYVKKEIDLQGRERELVTKTITTKREYKEITRRVVRLTKDATSMAKKYKDLENLYNAAWEIIYDMKRKGILNMSGDMLSKHVKAYFNQPSGSYYISGSYKKVDNLGYEYLAFYRDYSSQYNTGVRKNKI